MTLRKLRVSDVLIIGALTEGFPGGVPVAPLTDNVRVLGARFLHQNRCVELLLDIGGDEHGAIPASWDVPVLEMAWRRSG